MSPQACFAQQLNIAADANNGLEDGADCGRPPVGKLRLETKHDRSPKRDIGGGSGKVSESARFFSRSFERADR